MSTFESVDLSDGVLRYTLSAPLAGVLMQTTDFGVSNVSQGALGPTDALVLEAVEGGTLGSITGWARVLSNDDPHASGEFNSFSAPVGSEVRFEETFTLTEGATFTEDLPTREFRYIVDGFVDFTVARPVPEPESLAVVALIALLAAGRRIDVA